MSRPVGRLGLGPAGLAVLLALLPGCALGQEQPSVTPASRVVQRPAGDGQLRVLVTRAL
ncbi:MAG: hypothetical protein IGQ88_01260 [Gloeomargaritaceae cyanobacterium C42_A2020_066]|nr:hypothetical protein [Gloeomargaritaceae cyanobacterium C42_A2020_066]